MKLIGFAFLLMASFSTAAEDWKIHWGAAKGDVECILPYNPRPLDQFTHEIPEGHAEANDDRKGGLVPASATTILLGKFNGRKVLSLELHVDGGYYNRYFLILAEVEPSKYMPLYVHQFARGAHGHGQPQFAATHQNFSVSITSETHGTSPSSERFKITCDLKSPPKTE